MHVRDIGGLYVIGTERHESRRIDLQCVAAAAARETWQQSLLPVARR